MGNTTVLKSLKKFVFRLPDNVKQELQNVEDESDSDSESEDVNDIRHLYRIALENGLVETTKYCATKGKVYLSSFQIQM